MVSKIIRYLSFVWGAVLLTACSAGSIAPPADAEPEGMEFQMLLRMPLSGAPQTRADYNTDYYDGTHPTDGEYEGLDYTLLMGDLSILFYDSATGAFVEEALIGSVQPETSQTNFVDYRIRGRLTQILSNDPKMYRVVVLANMNGQLKATNYMTIRETEAALYAGLTFNYEGTNVAYDFTQNSWESSAQGSTLPQMGRVPMWGKTTAQLSAATPVQITMLRALAKVRVELSAALKTAGYSISNIQLFNPNDKGFVAPTGAKDAVKTDDCSALDVAINVPAAAHPLAAVQSFYEGKLGNAGKWYTYLPETKNKGVAEENRPYMQVFISRKEAGGLTTMHNYPFRLEFGDYEQVTEGEETYQGTLFDIRRNHYYLYEINDIDLTQNRLKVLVCQWGVKPDVDIFFH